MESAEEYSRVSAPMPAALSALVRDLPDLRRAWNDPILEHMRVYGRLRSRRLLEFSMWAITFSVYPMIEAYGAALSAIPFPITIGIGVLSLVIIFAMPFVARRYLAKHGVRTVRTLRNGFFASLDNDAWLLIPIGARRATNLIVAHVLGYQPLFSNSFATLMLMLGSQFLASLAPYFLWNAWLSLLPPLSPLIMSALAVFVVRPIYEKTLSESANRMELAMQRLRSLALQMELPPDIAARLSPDGERFWKNRIPLLQTGRGLRLPSFDPRAAMLPQLKQAMDGFMECYWLWRQSGCQLVGAKDGA